MGPLCGCRDASFVVGKADKFAMRTSPATTQHLRPLRGMAVDVARRRLLSGPLCADQTAAPLATDLTCERMTRLTSTPATEPANRPG